MSDLVKRVLGDVRNKLLDLTRRNRLLNYKESAKSIRIVDELPDEVFRILVSSGDSMEFLPIEVDEEGKPIIVVNVNELPVALDEIDDRHSDNRLQTPFGATVLEKRCKKLYQEARTAIEETGSNMLYLAIGFLEWYEADDSSEKTRAPLILLPTSIEKSILNKKSNCYTYTLSYTGDDIETNLSLAEKLKIDFDIILPELDECRTPEEYLKLVASAVMHKKRWKVAREMVLGLFSFSKLLMYRDLDPANWPSLPEHKNISLLLAGRDAEDEHDERSYGEEYDLDRDPKAANLPLITDADSSQTSVIIDAIHHQENLVVEGPPGTGKSQTITNIIAAALHKGLSVLFVAEKKAALEVVRSRLDHAGLGDFCLELHSHKTQKGQLHTDILKRVLKKYDDSMALDRQLEDLAKERNRLIAYSNLVNSVVGPSGETIYDIFWAVERCRNETGGRDIRLTISNPLALTRNQINDMANILMHLAKLRLDLTDEAMSEFSLFTPIDMLPGDEKYLVELLMQIKLAAEEHKLLLDSTVNSGCPLDTTIKSLRELCSIRDNELTELPQSFNQKLFPVLAQPNSLPTLTNLCSKIHDYKDDLKKALPVINACGKELPYDENDLIINAAASLVKMGFGGQSLSELLVTRQKQEQVIELLKNLGKTLELGAGWFEPKIKSVSETRKIQELDQFLSKTPFDQATPCYLEYMLTTTPSLLREAKTTALKLLGDLQIHGAFFLLRYVKKAEDIDALARGLREYRGSFFAFFSSRFRSLRREAKNILVNQADIKANDLIEKIEALSDTLKAASSLANNQTFIRHLGPGFAGIDTDWDTLESQIDWSQKLVTVVGSQQRASQIATALFEIKQSVTSTANLVAGLLDKMSDFGSSSLINDTNPISDLINQLENRCGQLGSDLEVLQKYPGLLQMNPNSIETSARALVSANGKETEINEDQARVLLGDEFRGINTDAESFLASSVWCDNLRKIGIRENIIEWLVENDTTKRLSIFRSTLKPNKGFWESHESILSKTRKYGSFSSQHLLVNTGFDGQLDAFSTSILAFACLQSYVQTWSDYCAVRSKCVDQELSMLEELVSSEKPTPDQAGAIYRQVAYESMAREILKNYPDLALFTRAEYEGVRQRYAATDRKIMELVRKRIAYVASNRPIPGGVNYGPVKEHTDFALLKRELSKQKRHIPIRQLVRRAVNALKALKPCFMMSPLSVAQYLDPKRATFDLVIMDEASQLKPEDALGAIARANQLIVVGDPKQLPPTSFFDRTDAGADDEDEAMAIQETESILDICMTTYSKRRLRWHYRSAHESLIAFSNSRFYDDDLIIFPSPLGSDCSYGVHSHFVEGATYHKGRNMLEAETVAKAIVEHFRSNRQNSLGVATFNREQAELISDILDRYQKDQPWLEMAIKDSDVSEEPFFIKNLENVQGDERDVIFVSTTYGPDKETGKVFQRFGPIAGKDGWRRLNVIFTRAKKQLELFTSMRAADIKLTDNPSKGTVSLKEYLEYAETGRLPSYGTVGCKEPDSDFEVSVAHHLSLHGYKTVAQVGVAGFFIDIGVTHPEREGEFVIGVECDGATYHSAKSIRDRDRLRQEILEKKGWTIHRIWSTDWFKNRDNEVTRLLKAVKGAVAKKNVTVHAGDDFQLAVKKVIQSLSVETTAERKNSPPQNKNTSKAEAGVQPDFVMYQQYKIKGLREELLEYRLMNILPSFDDDENGILRDEILSRLIVHKPTTKEDFYKAVPLELRQKTDGRQMQYIDDILEIIDGYVC